MDLTKGIILEHLEHLDVLSEDFPKDKTFILTIIGGAAFMLHDLTDRPTTTDIDTFVSVNDDKFTLSSFEILLGDEISESISSSLDINSDVYFFKLKDFIMEVENEETFISPTLDAEILNLIIRTPSIETLVITKLIVSMENDPERNDRDFIDISSRKIIDKLNISKLEEKIFIWKKKYARSSEIQKFNNELKRWTNHHNIEMNID